MIGANFTRMTRVNLDKLDKRCREHTASPS
jgi:hypothetical protein